MQRKVSFVEMPTLRNCLPLASGYLEACARADPDLRREYSFRKLSLETDRPEDDVFNAVVAEQADVYGFSCYTWNTGRVRRLVKRLRQSRPSAWIVLGGPQVIDSKERSLPEGLDRVIVCNGEGENILPPLLKALLDEHPSLEQVKGLSFRRDGELVTTEPAPLPVLDETPSPFLTGLFDDQLYAHGLFETTRGCPYRCGFCFWGSGSAKVRQFNIDRLKEELEWLVKKNVFTIQFCDANWGMLKRDLELTEHVARLRREHGFPYFVQYCGAKNKPEATYQVAKIFADASIYATPTVSFQSLNAEALKNAKRSNIKLSAYDELHKKLEADGLSSFCEMIWPLPGETLQSFREGLEELVRRGMDSISTYTLRLLGGTDLYERRAEFGFQTVPISDPNYEGECVIGTREVTPDEFHAGLWYYFSLFVAYNARALYYLTRYLDAAGLERPSKLYATLAEAFQQYPDFPITTRVTQALADNLDDVTFEGKLIHYANHEHRGQLDLFLRTFAQSQPWWSDAGARAALELDLLNRYFPYQNTRPQISPTHFEALKIDEVGRSYCIVTMSAESQRALARHLDRPPVELNGGGQYRVRYVRDQMPYMPAKGMIQNAYYCNGLLQSIGNVMPVWQRV
jgi:radical SAM superfamily enzyme YgiQ (UPF0313 family)